MPHLSIDRLQLNYQSVGEGPAVLLVHGWASSWRMWARSMSRLAQAGYQAWAVDLIGFGESDKPVDGWYTLERFTQVLAEFCDRMELVRPAVVGHSMGGTIALSLAAQRDVRALVVVAPVVNGELSFSLHLLLTSPVARRLFRWMRKQAFFSALGDKPLVAVPGLFRDPIRRRNHQDLRATTVNAAVGSLRTVVTSNLENHLTGIRAPTLVLVGGRDMAVWPAQGRLAAQLIPGARLVVWPDASHLLIDERGDDFDALLLDHLSGTRAVSG
ncbi:MAG TPA: alpha/beta hydrolase [Anaerolineae bacterium]|nr:alpha/beta hydrolase [Anaerolineae bacterium]